MLVKLTRRWADECEAILVGRAEFRGQRDLELLKGGAAKEIGPQSKLRELLGNVISSLVEASRSHSPTFEGVGCQVSHRFAKARFGFGGSVSRQRARK